MEWEAELKQAISEGDEIKADEITARALEEGAAPKDLLEKGAVAGIYEAGRLWQNGTFFLPDIILATEAYKEVMKRIEPLLESGDVSYKGKVVMGSVEGDAHDIGKNIVVALLRSASYEVVDLGVDVPLQDFVDKARELEADVLGMGAYMTTSMRGMEEVIRLVGEAGLRDQLKVIVGGAAVSRDYAESIGADGYGNNAAETVELVDRLLGVV
jgi:corrinoid protein of di/trimethylamine methyltransferase